jgi:hypothetical protein
MYTTLSLHDITNITIDERVNKTYVTRKLTMTDKNGDQAFITLFADDRNALTFNYNPMEDTRENAA